MNNAKRILYDPLSWLHPSRFVLPEYLNSTRSRSIINGKLLDGLHLSTEDIFSERMPCTKIFVNQWKVLPEIAFLLFCQRFRTQLAYRNRIAALPESVQRFMRINLLGHGSEALPLHFGVKDFLSQSIQELKPYFPQLPDALQRRIPLLFPEVLTPLYQEDVYPHSLSLKLAIQHVKIYPYTISSFY